MALEVLQVSNYGSIFSPGKGVSSPSTNASLFKSEFVRCPDHNRHTVLPISLEKALSRHNAQLLASAHSERWRPEHKFSTLGREHREGRPFPAPGSCLAPLACRLHARGQEVIFKDAGASSFHVSSRASTGKGRLSSSRPALVPVKTEGGWSQRAHSKINPGTWQALNWLTGVKTIPLARERVQMNS